MVVVIQCAATKRQSAGCLFSAGGRRLVFVARPESAPADSARLYARPDDPSGNGKSWREILLEYNEHPGNNPLGLCPAWQLYENPTYEKLVKEPLKNSPIHRLSVYGVSRGEKADATANSGGADGLREVRAEDEAGAVSRGDGAGGAVGRVTGAGGTALSEGRERAASGRTEHHVAGVLSAAVVQPERSGSGGCAV